MLTIGQLAAFAGVTVKAVRHYHKIGLLPEPCRDHSGYRSYDAAAVVRLIRIHTLADAGVPLARVAELLTATPAEFTAATNEIDKRLRAEARRIQQRRKRIARLAGGDDLTLPASVVDYLDRLRQMGVVEWYLEMERDAWIILAAQLPDQIDQIITDKHTQLDDPDTNRLYRLFVDVSDWTADSPQIPELVDVLDRIFTRAAQTGDGRQDDVSGQLAALLDAQMLDVAPAAERIRTLLEQRGWTGWTRPTRAPDH